MSVIAWIILGLIAGFIASKLVNKTGEGVILDIVLGVVGAIVGGFLFSFFGAAGVTGFNIWSLIVAIIGSVVVLWIYHMITGTRSV
ncbi:MAG TPA: GlsB/YeaQ/YmgE family stress response membrane protein [Rhodopila sp.]|nr:GlsB/YeaQ/YmgE family stress response membrane protein [Rhodopila sp.]